MNSRKVPTPDGQKPEFALWFATNRRNHGSQDIVAAKLEISRSTIARWEAGEVVPSPEQIPRIAKLFLVSDQEVAKRVGVVLESEISTRSLSLARLIESKTSSWSDAQIQSLTRGLDGILTASNMMSAAA
jgi:transcriptional regulator with XRE-family HTH domain